MDKHTILSEYFGYSSFRSGQEELVDAVIAGRDALGIMPTGGGKSICYQVPALAMDGTALVISPLISLMEDQVMALRNAGISAAFINSSLSSDEFRDVCYNMHSGKYKIVYVAPERLEGSGFISLASDIKISLIAVDEAHCISQWGQDFRPSYLRILDFLQKLPVRPPLAAFTATATPRVMEDIERILELHNPVRVITGFDRPNLFFDVRKPKNKLYEVLSYLENHPDKSGIIYCSTRRDTEKLCDELAEKDISVTRYHAGLSDRERKRNQEDFIYDRKQVMVATNAFGMGIDKSNVGFVIHYNMPKSLEAYYQEAGRAGRDGEKADCILLFSAGDINTARFLIQQSGSDESISEEERAEILIQDYARLEVMVGYCKTSKCLRGYILEYFGQKHDESCSNCGNCLGTFVTRDITREAQMILSCIKRSYDRLGYHVGSSLIASILRGGGEKRIIDLGLNNLSTYGLMKAKKKAEIVDIINHLISEGYIRKDPVHLGISLTVEARGVLFDGKKVILSTRGDTIAKKLPAMQHKTSARRNTEIHDSELMNALKALRSKLAREYDVPAYIIFSNATLTDMAEKRPRNMSEFMTVSGVGETKSARYGDLFLRVIREYKNA